jgi:hypothetical protein
LCERWCDFGPWAHFPELSTSKAAGGGIEWARHMYDTTFSPEYRVWQDEEWLPTTAAGVGYILVADDPELASTGPVMPLQKLGAMLRRRHGRLHHACRDCMLGAAVDAVALIAAGDICETPFCARAPDGRCGCCGAMFCRSCLTPGGYSVAGVTCGHGTWPVVYSQASGQPDDPDIACSTRERYPPGGLCVPCACERIHALKTEATRAFEQDYEIRLARLPGPGGRPLFAVPTASRLTSGGKQKETRKSREVARRYAAEIATRAARAVDGSACRRAMDAPAAATFAPHTGYVLVGMSERGTQREPARLTS